MRTCKHEAGSASTHSTPRVDVQAGADVNARTRFGFTPLMTAAHRGSLAAAVALVKANADVHAADAHGYTAAELAER